MLGCLPISRSASTPNFRLSNTSNNSGSVRNSRYRIDIGALDSGLEGVLNAFENNFKGNKEFGAQFAVYHRGKKIVDLSGCRNDLPDYTSNTLQIIYSSSKTVTSLIIASLVDKGLLDYNERIMTYWPEFGQNGKENIYLKDLLKHEAGLAWFDGNRTITNELLLPKNEKEFSEFLAKSIPIWLHENHTIEIPNGNNNKPKRVVIHEKDRIYHAVTRGFFLNEIVKRVDPQKRTIGKILLQDIVPYINATFSLEENDKLNLRYGFAEVDCFSPEIETLKTIKNEHYHFQHYELVPVPLAIAKVVYNMAKKKVVKREEDKFHKHLPKEIVHKCNSTVEEIKDRVNRRLMKEVFTSMLLEGPKSTHSKYNHEGPSYNLIANAKGLAMLGHAFLFAEDGRRILSRETIDKMFADPTCKADLSMMASTIFVNGGFSHFAESSCPNFLHDFFGWQGVGGSVFAFSPKHELVVAYTPCKLTVTSFGGFLDKRCIRIMRELMLVFDPQAVLSCSPSLRKMPSKQFSSQQFFSEDSQIDITDRESRDEKDKTLRDIAVT